MQHARAQISRPAHSSGFFFASGFQVGRLLLALVGFLTLTASLPAISAAQSTPDASPVASAGGLDAAVAWLAAQQDPSGAFVGFSGQPDPGATIDAVLALSSTDFSSQSALSAAAGYLQTNAQTIVDQGDGDTAKLMLAMIALEQDPANVSGLNLIELITDSVDDDSGLCGLGVYDHALCMLALAGAKQPVPQSWVDALVSFQIENGGWAFDGSREAPMADSNTTAIVIQALTAAGITPDQAPIVAGLGYLASVMAPGGGFAYAVADPLVADANSTSIVIQALIAAGEDPASAEWGNAFAALTSFQNESGAFRYMLDMQDDNLFATVQAIPALAGAPLPIAG
jgi:hypothetical protein